LFPTPVLATLPRFTGIKVVEDSNKTTMHTSQRELAHEEETRVGGEEAGTRGGARQERETLLLAYCERDSVACILLLA